MIVETPMPSWTVYAHIAPGGKMYVGMTGIKPWQRWGYGHGYKDIPRFYNAILEYGWKNIQHEIVASGLTKEEASHMEKLLIEKLDLTNPEFGYNTMIGNEPMQDTLLKQSASIKAFYAEHGAYPNPRQGTGVLQTMQYRNNDSYKGNMEKSPGSARRIKCIDTGIEYDSVVNAALATGIPRNHIYANALGARTNAGGMQWEYVEPPHRLNHIMSEKYRENKRGIKNGRARSVMCLETGEIFDTCQDLALKLGVVKSKVSNFMHGSKKHLGLHYEYLDKGDKTNGACI